MSDAMTLGCSGTATHALVKRSQEREMGGRNRLIWYIVPKNDPDSSLIKASQNSPRVGWASAERFVVQLQVRCFSRNHRARFCLRAAT
jgi:hypothetical protein